MTNAFKKIIVAGLIFAPSVTFAQLNTFYNYALRITDIVALLIPLAIAIAVVVFIYGVIRYIYKADSEDAKADGRRIMIGGIIALFVIVSIWGIIELLQYELGVTRNAAPSSRWWTTFPL